MKKVLPQSMYQSMWTLCGECLCVRSVWPDQMREFWGSMSLPLAHSQVLWPLASTSRARKESVNQAETLV